MCVLNYSRTLSEVLLVKIFNEAKLIFPIETICDQRKIPLRWWRSIFLVKLFSVMDAFGLIILAKQWLDHCMLTMMLLLNCWCEISSIILLVQCHRDYSIWLWIRIQEANGSLRRLGWENMKRFRDCFSTNPHWTSIGIASFVFIRQISPYFDFGGKFQLSDGFQTLVQWTVKSLDFWLR